jgi:TM2 domain-containing membrane protein YozV
MYTVIYNHTCIYIFIDFIHAMDYVNTISRDVAELRLRVHISA